MNQDKTNKLSVNYWFLMAIFALTVIAGLVATLFFIRTNSLANKKIADAAEAKRPANVELVTITDNSCKDCFDINTVLNYIKKENINITAQKTVDKNSEEGKQLIQEFDIAKLPAFTLKGELNKLTNLAEFFAQTGDTANSTFVFRQVGAPYVAADTGTIKGRVSLTLLTDTSCTTCYDVTQHETILKNNFGINTTANVVDAKTAAGQALIKKYNIKLVPTFVLSGEVAEYPSLKQAWEQVGTVAADGTHVFNTGVPLMGTYRDLSTNKTITPVAETAPQQ